MGFQNFFATKLYTDIGASDTTIALETVPTVTSGRLVLEARNPTQREIIKYTGVSGNTITGVTRGHGGTTAKSHLKNALVEMNATAGDLSDLYDAWNSFVAANSPAAWIPLVQAPTVTATKGNFAYDISIPTDLTSVLERDMYLKIPRTGGAVPTQSLDLDGSSQYAIRTNASGISGISFTNEFTAEAWVYLDAYPIDNTGGIVLQRRQSGTVGWTFRVSVSGKIDIFGGNAAPDLYSSDISLPLGQWVHIAATINVSAKTGKTWVNGALVSGAFTDAASTSISQGTGDLVIGRQNYTTNSYFDGRVADVRLWSGARTDAQIRDNMNQQLVGNETNLTGYWKLAGNLNDSTANANHLTGQAGAAATYTAYPFHDTEYVKILTKPTYGSGVTSMTVWSGNEGMLPNQVLDDASYSPSNKAIGIPTRLRKSQLYLRNDAAVALSSNASFIQVAYLIRDGDTLYFSFQNITTAVAVTDAELNMGTIDLPSFGITQLAGRTFLSAFADGGNAIVEMWLYENGRFNTVDLQPGTSMAAGNTLSGTFIARIE